MIPIWVFAFSAGAITYVLFIYPLAVAVASRYWRRPIRKDTRERSVSIILPVRDGQDWIRQKLESIAALDYPKHLIDTIVVVDGATDATEDIAREYVNSGVHVLTIPSGGKARALNAGIAQATGELLFFTDVRQTFDRDALRKVVACFGDPTVGVVSGELVIRDGQTAEELTISVYWKYEKWVRMRLSALHSFPGATGCFYLIRRELATMLPPEVLVDDVYVPLHAFFRGYRVIFEPGAIAHDYPTSLHDEFRRKVRTLAGVYQMMLYYPKLLVPSHGMWFHFMSHKIGRLLLPYALVTTAVSSFWLPDIWRVLIPMAQVVFYSLALIDYLVPERSRLKSVTAAVRTFVVLMAAAVCALAVFFVPSRALWKHTRVRAAAQ